MRTDRKFIKALAIAAALALTPACHPLKIADPAAAYPAPPPELMVPPGHLDPIPEPKNGQPKVS